ncbi:MAG: hypothetical protein BWY37_02015 [Firmicutes bacterium ADurb.Bin262]|nr:MAG: hypothetical protein BWY37_02015 [Firmicutes bacterium ADurb.Bin262]
MRIKPLVGELHRAVHGSVRIRCAAAVSGRIPTGEGVACSCEGVGLQVGGLAIFYALHLNIPAAAVRRHQHLISADRPLRVQRYRAFRREIQDALRRFISRSGSIRFGVPVDEIVPGPRKAVEGKHLVAIVSVQGACGRASRCAVAVINHGVLIGGPLRDIDDVAETDGCRRFGLPAGESIAGLGNGRRYQGIPVKHLPAGAAFAPRR